MSGRSVDPEPPWSEPGRWHRLVMRMPEPIRRRHLARLADAYEAHQAWARRQPRGQAAPPPPPRRPPLAQIGQLAQLHKQAATIEAAVRQLAPAQRGAFASSLLAGNPNRVGRRITTTAHRREPVVTDLSGLTINQLSAQIGELMADADRLAGADDVSPEALVALDIIATRVAAARAELRSRFAVIEQADTIAKNLARERHRRPGTLNRGPN